MRYKTICQEYTNDCGPACIATVAKYYGKNISVPKVKDSIEKNDKPLNLKDMKLALEKFGFNTKFGKIKKTNLFKVRTLPFILSIRINDSNHYIVVFSIKKNHIIVGDPTTGTIKINKTNNMFDEINAIILLKTNIHFQGVEESKSFEEYFRNILIINRRRVLKISTISILLTILSISSCFIYSFMFDYIIPQKSISKVIITCSFFGLIYILKFICDYLRQKSIILYSQKIENHIMSDIYNSLLYLPKRYFEIRKKGDILARIHDAFSLKNTLSVTLTSISMDSLIIIVGISALSIIRYELLVLIVIQIGFSIFFLKIFKSKIIELDKEVKIRSSNLEAIINDIINGYQHVKINSAENLKLSKIWSEYSTISNLNVKYGNVITLNINLSELSDNLFRIILLCVGSYLVLERKISLGELVTFISISTFFNNPIKNLVNSIPQFLSANITYNRTLEIIDCRKEQIYDNKEIFEEFNTLEVKDISYSYEGKYILKDLNLTFSKGEIIGIIGNSGSGKTTLINLIYGFLKLQNGLILINGKPITTYKLKSLREKIGYVAQSSYLFSESIKSNMIGCSEEKENEMKKLIKEFGLEKTVLSLPNKYDTIVAEGGSSFSKGQLQKFCIIQQLLRDTEILILDEATASLDILSEIKIMRTLKEYNKSIIVVSHKVSTMLNCDNIYILEDGKLKFNGTHKELLVRSKYYRSIYEHQKI